MNGPANGQPQPPFAPGMHVQPGPITSAAKRLPDGVIVLHFEHATGATTLVCPPDFVKGLINQLQEVTGGLVVPTPIIPGAN